MSFRPRKVSKHAALNPIAQAVARANLSKEVLNAKVRLLLADDLAEQEHDVQGVSRYLALAMTAAAIDDVFHDEVAELSLVLDVLAAASLNGFRVPRDEVIDICDAIDLSTHILGNVSKPAIRKADLALLATEGSS